MKELIERLEEHSGETLSEASGTYRGVYLPLKSDMSRALTAGRSLEKISKSLKRTDIDVSDKGVFLSDRAMDVVRKGGSEHFFLKRMLDRANRGSFDYSLDRFDKE